MEHKTMKTANNGVIIMITVMSLLLMELDASLRLLPVLMISHMVMLYFTQNKVVQTQSKENYANIQVFF